MTREENPLCSVYDKHCPIKIPFFIWALSKNELEKLFNNANVCANISAECGIVDDRKNLSKLEKRFPEKQNKKLVYDGL